MNNNKLFPIKFVEKGRGFGCVRIDDNANLWHLRFGHVNFQSLKLLSPLVYGFSKVEDTTKFCEGCAIGKQARGHFQKNEAWRVQSLIQMVHSEFCGPMQT